MHATFAGSAVSNPLSALSVKVLGNVYTVPRLVRIRQVLTVALYNVSCNIMERLVSIDTKDYSIYI